MLLLPVWGLSAATRPDVLLSFRASEDFELTADPAAAAWKKIKGVFAGRGPQGEPVAGHRTEIRSRWTAKNLYFLFICPYEQLFLKANPSTTSETNFLWKWDAAEVFVGADFEHIRHYREFQVSPQGEWVDLDIDLDHSDPARRWLWNSGFQVKARIVRDAKIWYGEMKIPIASIDSRPPGPGNEMRINLYRIQGPPPERKFIAWRPTGSASYHVPEAFGKLRFVE